MRVDEMGMLIRRASIVLMMSVMLGGCGVLGNDIQQAAPDGATREIDVKRALIGSESVGAAAIRVVVDEDGTVTLDGFVDSEAERIEALRVARGALGGEEPVDALQVFD